MMLKAIAIYRDGSKLSQPLNSALADGLDEIVTLGDEHNLNEALGPKDVFEMQTHRLVRKRLPKKRGGFTREAHVGGQKIFVRTGEYEDGTLGEIFLDMYKEGAAFRGMLNSFAILVSKALQYGIPLEELVDTFTFTKFEPQGIVQGHEALKFASSVLDYVFRSLGYDYLGRTDFVQVHSKKEKSTHHISHSSHTSSENISKDTSAEKEIKQQRTITEDTDKITDSKGTDTKSIIDKLLEEVGETPEPMDMLSIPFVPFSAAIDAANSLGVNGIKAKSLGYTGEQCTNCSSMRVRRNGTCLLCEDCGATSGCS
jgi:ribonucleoside-diphosphate reductase alpha chain